MIYLIYGSDIEFAINKEIKNALKENSINVDEFAATSYEYPNASIQEIVDDCLTIPFLTDKKGIIVKNCSFLNKETNDVKPLIEYVKSPSNTTVLILIYKGSINEKLEVVEEIKKVAKLCKINEISAKEWPQVINQLINQYNLEIDDDAREEFINRTSGNLDRVLKQLSKLKMFNGFITKEIVVSMVDRPLEDNMFGMVDALLDGKIDEAIKIYNDLKIQNTDPIILVSGLATQFRFLYQVKHLHEQGYNNDEVAKELDNIKPGRVYYALKKIGYHNENEIMDILNELADLDEKMRLSEIDKYMAFEMFLVKGR